MLTSKQIRILVPEVQKQIYAIDLAAGNYDVVASSLNDRLEIANPDPQPQRPALIAWDEFLDLLQPADVLVMYGYGQLASDLRLALNQNDRTITLAIWRGLKTVLTQDSISAVQNAANQTEPDPNWSATILQPSIAMALGLPTVSSEDIQLIHHRMLQEQV